MGRGGKVLRRELEFFRKNRARMDCRGAKDAGCPIGSDCVESSNKFLVQQRMKRSGQRLGTGGRSERPHLPRPAEIGTVRRCLPRHGAPTEGKIARQVAGLGPETGARHLIRNRETDQKTQKTMRESRPTKRETVGGSGGAGHRRPGQGKADPAKRRRRSNGVEIAFTCHPNHVQTLSEFAICGHSGIALGSSTVRSGHHCCLHVARQFGKRAAKTCG